MDVKLQKVLDIGIYDKERVVIKVERDIDIGRFGIFKTNVNLNELTNKVQNVYWFPDKLVKAGDMVVLYSKLGITSEIKNTDGSTTHFYYWGMTSAIWSGPKNGTVLFSIPEWQSIIFVNNHPNYIGVFQGFFLNLSIY
jgi:hypothetical protein